VLSLSFDPKPQATAFVGFQKRLRLRLRVKQFNKKNPASGEAGFFRYSRKRSTD
jgi:hypothetical protein